MTTSLDLRRTCWSDGRAGTAGQLRSTAAFVRRSFWAEEWKRQREPAPSCRVCDRLWTPRTGVLHDLESSASRRQLQLDDLLPLCAAHHDALHRQVETVRRSRAVDLREATYDALYVLQRRHHRQTWA